MHDFKPVRKKSSRLSSKSRSRRATSNPKKSVKKAKKTSPFAIFVVRLILFLFGGALLLSLSSYLFSYFFPLKSAKTIFIVTETEQVAPRAYLVRFVPSEQNMTLIELDANTSVDVLGGYGRYKLYAVYPLLKIEKKSASFIRSALSFALETLVDDVLVVSESDSIETKEDLERILFEASNKSFPKLFRTHTLFSLYSFSREADFEKEAMMPDGFSSRSKLALQAETPESCPVAIVNTTQTRGLAGKIAAIFANSGINVIRVDSDSQNRDNSQVYFDETIPDCVNLVQTISPVVFDSSVESNREIAERYRAGIVVLLGEDFQ